MYQTFLQWLPLIIVFVAGSLALHQIRVNNITNARIKWLDNLKQLISEFFSEAATILLKEGLVVEIDRKRAEKKDLLNYVESFSDEMRKSIVGHLKVIGIKHNLILLNLNPKEEIHMKFEQLLEDYMKLFNDIPEKKYQQESFEEIVEKMSAYSGTLTLLARFIMKLEWEKTKRSFISRKYY